MPRRLTQDHDVPGAFEGETMTRRRALTTTAHTTGAVALAAVLLPSIGFAVGPIFQRPKVRWQPIGRPAEFRDDTYVAKVLTVDPEIGEAGKATIFVRRRNARIDVEPGDRWNQFIVLTSRCRTWAARSRSRMRRRSSSARATAGCTTWSASASAALPAPAGPLLHPGAGRAGRGRPALQRRQRAAPLPPTQPGRAARRHRQVPLPAAADDPRRTILMALTGGGRSPASAAAPPARGRCGARHRSPSESRSGAAPAAAATAEGRPPQAAGCTPPAQGRSARRDGTATPGTAAAPSRPLLEHAATVGADVVRAAVVVGVEQPADAAEAGRLEVEQAGSPWQRLDVADRVDRLVPRDPVLVVLEQLDGLVVHGGILDPRLRKRLEHPPVEVGLGSIATVALRYSPFMSITSTRRTMPALPRARRPSLRWDRA